MSAERKNQNRVVIYIPCIVYDELKKICTERDTPMTRYIVKSIVSRINMEAKQKIKY